MNQFVKEELLSLREPQGREKRHQKLGLWHTCEDIVRWRGGWWET